jgi:hypothetical protein
MVILRVLGCTIRCPNCTVQGLLILTLLVLELGNPKYSDVVMDVIKNDRQGADLIVIPRGSGIIFESCVRAAKS